MNDSAFEVAFDDPASIVAALEALDNRFPEATLRAAQGQREAVTPLLIQALADAAERLRTAEDPDEVELGWTPLLALFLLTEFRAKEALPAILNAIRLPNDIPHILFGDAIHECLPHTLGSLVDSPSVLDELIDDGAVYEYVRWAACDAYVEFVVDGRMTREEVVARLADRLQAAIARKDDVVSPLVCSLIDYSPREVFDVIQEAFQRGLVDEFLIKFHHFKETLSRGDAEFEATMLAANDWWKNDHIDELSHWNWDGEEDSEAPEDFGTDDFANRSPVNESHWNEQDTVSNHRFCDDDLATEDEDSAGGTIQYIEPRIGRNDPCSCGSGRKFKKCCGANR